MDYGFGGLTVTFFIKFCVALLSPGSVILIQGAIYIENGPKDQKVHAGKEVVFSCRPDENALHHGIPEVRWYKDDHSLDMTRTYLTGWGDKKAKKYIADTENSRLHIFNATLEDAGRYTCVASLYEETDTASAVLVVQDVPDAPIDVRLGSCHSRLAQIQWKLMSDNHSPIIQFVIEYNTSFDPGTWHIAKTQLPTTKYYQRIAVSPWGNYSFRVIAQNAVGSSKPSSVTKKICHMPPDVPHHNPRHVCTENVQPQTLLITWELMPQSEHNAPGFYYLIKWRKKEPGSNKKPFDERIVDSTVSQLRVNGQAIYRAYEIYVLAQNSIGEAVSPPKMYIGYSAEDVPLEVPRNFRLHPDKDVTDKTADFTWDEVRTGPRLMKGFFRGYKIKYWQTGKKEETLREHSIIYREPDPCGTVVESVEVPNGHFDNSRGATVNGRRHRRHSRHKREKLSLTNTGHIYNLWPFSAVTAEIVVLNAKYEGLPSRPIHFHTKEGVSEAVTQFAVLRRDSYHFELSWGPPDVVNGKLLGYEIEYQVIDPGRFPVNEVFYNNPLMKSTRLGGLLPNHSYRITIYAVNGRGRGEGYSKEDKTLRDGPLVAPNFTVNQNERAANVTWVPSANGNPGSVFTVQHRRLGSLVWLSSAPVRSRSWANIQGLLPDTNYEVRVVVSNGETGDRERNVTTHSKRIPVDLKRDTSEISFALDYITDSSRGIILLDHTPDIRSYYAQYKPSESTRWLSTRAIALNDYQKITLRNLEPGRSYDVRIVAMGINNNLYSDIKIFKAGKDPGALAAIGLRNGAVSSFSLPTTVLTCCLVLVHVVNFSHFYSFSLFIHILYKLFHPLQSSLFEPT